MRGGGGGGGHRLCLPLCKKGGGGGGMLLPMSVESYLSPVAIKGPPDFGHQCHLCLSV